MYPVRLGIDVAKNRINSLIENGHQAEALLTAVFTFEKTLHRTLKQLIVSSGFRSKDANQLIKIYKVLTVKRKYGLVLTPKIEN